MLAAMVVVMATGLARTGLAAEEMPARDRQVIQMLLDRLREREDLKFVRGTRPTMRRPRRGI